jgi:hypothetical protein
MNTHYTITDSFPRDIDNVPCQPTPKFLLTAIREVYNTNNYFTRAEVNTWMIENINNPLYEDYNGGIRSENNLKNYWNNAHKNMNDENHSPHNSRILNFQTFYEPI